MRKSLFRILALSLVCLSLSLRQSSAADLVYVTNIGNNTVTRYYTDTGDQYPGDITTNLSAPTGISFDTSGNMFVANYADITVSKFLKSGTDFTWDSTFSVEYPTPDTNPAKAPQSILFGPSGLLYVAGEMNMFDGTGRGIGVYDSSGAYQNTIALPNLKNPVGLAFDQQGRLWTSVTDQGNFAVYRFDATDAIDLTITNSLAEPTGIAIASNNDLYVSNRGNGTILRYTADSSYTTVETFVTGLVDPRGLGFDSDGKLWVADLQETGYLYKYDVTDGASPLLTISTNLNYPIFLAFQPVPEPSTWALGGFGTAVLAIASRRRNRSTQN